MQTIKYKRAISVPTVQVAITKMCEVTGLPRWLCSNVLVWRYMRGLTIRIAKAVEEYKQ